MSRATLASGIELEYDTFGSADAPALLLVMGFTAQMIAWDEQFCRQIAERGRFVIRFDNRDCGLSTKLDGQMVDLTSALSAVLTGSQPPPIPEDSVPYTLSDMAADGIGLLDHLGIDRAHVVGASMGGMIVQTMAIEHPDRLLSLTSIMSTVGDQAYGAPTAEAIQVLLTPPMPTREGAIARSADFKVWASRRYFDAALTAEMAGRSFDRSFYPEGALRQLAAIYASGDRSERLADVAAPTLVIHGLDDTLITPSGGRRTAELVPGAHLLELADMGHDLPGPLWPLITGAIVAHGDTVHAGSAVEVAS
ncbi:alpha/beta fold hydrolase [Ilumatobacter sp.]|uniref:alpha/beta fold hydrolase n=1 Tax=Ilumatobacter sp. TaxID=1967498 RepID=UPI003AF580BD